MVEELGEEEEAVIREKVEENIGRSFEKEKKNPVV
jgi:hypothetical protein